MGVVFGGVWLCEHALKMIVCVVFVVLLVGVMRWLLCGDDGSKKDQNDICNYRKISRERIFSITDLY